jgi:DNA-directed RNA polymerase subunit RPC12/RpoP
VQSFYAPYLCESCGTSFQAVIDGHVHQDAVRTRVAPAVVCPNCGSDARYDGTKAAFASASAALAKRWRGRRP